MTHHWEFLTLNDAAKAVGLNFHFPSCEISAVIRVLSLTRRRHNSDIGTVKKIMHSPFRTNVFRSGGTPDVDLQVARAWQKSAHACYCRRLRFPNFAMYATERHRSFPSVRNIPNSL